MKKPPTLAQRARQRVHTHKRRKAAGQAQYAADRKRGEARSKELSAWRR